MLNKSTESIKKVLQELKSARKYPPVENQHHAETSQSTRNADKLTVCKQNVNLRTNQSTINHKYLVFLNIN